MGNDDCTAAGQEAAVGGRDGYLHKQCETTFKGGGGRVELGQSPLPANIELPEVQRKTDENVPFTSKVEQVYVDEKKANRDLKDYVGGAVIGGVSGGLAGAGLGAAAGAGVGLVIGGILGNAVPAPGTAMGALIGAGVGAGIGALAGGGAGGGIGVGVGAVVVAIFKRKIRKTTLLCANLQHVNNLPTLWKPLKTDNMQFPKLENYIVSFL